MVGPDRVSLKQATKVGFDMKGWGRNVEGTVICDFKLMEKTTKISLKYLTKSGIYIFFNKNALSNIQRFSFLHIFVWQKKVLLK